MAAILEAIFGFLGIGILVGGYLSVSLYRRWQPSQLITTGMGARLGAVAGGLGFFIVSIVTSVKVLLFDTGNQLRDAMMKSIEQAAARNPGPEAQQMLDWLRSPNGFALMLGLGLLVTLVFYLVLSMAGGMLAAGMANRRRRPGGVS